MHGTGQKGAIGIILLVAAATVVFCAAVGFVLVKMDVFVYYGWGGMAQIFNLVTGYLGTSPFFFVLVFVAYCIYAVLLKRNMKSIQKLKAERQQIENTNPSGENSRLDEIGTGISRAAENIRFYNSGIDLFITVFFAIGVLYTAWGLQNSLVAALGGVSKAEAGQMGAWGILKRLVDNGILIALWTTIVGGAGGYLMRLCKYIFLGRDLNRFVMQTQESDRRLILGALESIRLQVAQLEEKITPASGKQGGSDVAV